MFDGSLLEAFNTDCPQYEQVGLASTQAIHKQQQPNRLDHLMFLLLILCTCMGRAAQLG
jgi:hypothetical protein